MSSVVLEEWATPELKKAIEELERLRGDEKMHRLYERRLLAVQLLATELQDSYQQGREKGLEEGPEKGLEKGREAGHRAGFVESVLFDLEIRFGEAALGLKARLEAMEDLASLRAIEKALAAGKDLETIGAMLDGEAGTSKL